MPKRSYSDNEKARALAILDANEGNVAKTARMVNVPRKTLSEWAVDRYLNEDVAEIRQHEKKALADELEDLAYELVGAIPRFVRSPFTKLQEVSNTLGIVIEKCALLRGKPTGINENRNTNTDEAFRIFKELSQGLGLSDDELRKQYELMNAQTTGIN